MAVEHQARRIAPAWLPQGIADPSRSRRPSERFRRTCWSMAATACRRSPSMRRARTRHHRRGDRQDPGRRGPARKPADALPHSLRLCRPQGDRRQYRLSAVAQPDRFQREDGSLRRHRAERNARSGVLRELCCKIKANVLKLIADEFPDALQNATFAITDADASNPVALLRTVDRDPTKLAQRHRRRSTVSRGWSSAGPGSLLDLDAPDAYVWSLYHLLQNEDVIKNTMFPITYFAANGADWIAQGSERPRYFDIGERDYRGNVDDRTLSLIADHPPVGARGRLAPPARHGRRHPQQGCRHQPPDLRHHLHVGRKLRSRAALQRLCPLQRRKNPQPAAAARGRHLLCR